MDTTWTEDFCQRVHTLMVQSVDDYSMLLDDLSASAKRWQEWVEAEHPEEEPLPGKIAKFDCLWSHVIKGVLVICVHIVSNIISFAKQRFGQYLRHLEFGHCDFSLCMRIHGCNLALLSLMLPVHHRRLEAHD